MPLSLQFVGKFDIHHEVEAGAVIKISLLSGRIHGLGKRDRLLIDDSAFKIPQNELHRRFETIFRHKDGVLVILGVVINDDVEGVIDLKLEIVGVI